MVQILGFLGCAYLFIKGLELLGRASRYDAPIRWVKRGSLPEEERKAAEWDARGHGQTYLAGLLAIVASIVFALWLLAQGSVFANGTQSFDDLNALQNVDENLP